MVCWGDWETDFLSVHFHRLTPFPYAEAKRKKYGLVWSYFIFLKYNTNDKGLLAISCLNIKWITYTWFPVNFQKELEENVHYQGANPFVRFMQKISGYYILLINQMSMGDDQKRKFTGWKICTSNNLPFPAMVLTKYKLVNCFQSILQVAQIIVKIIKICICTK